MMRRAGFSLTEMLIVVAIIGILAGAAIVTGTPSSNAQLRAAAEFVAQDIAYARSLAVMHNSKYTLTFDTTGNCYTLRHSGSDVALNTLPVSVRVTYSASPSEQVFDLDDVPAITGVVQFAGVRTSGNLPATVTTLEFDSLGATTRSDRTIVWLMSGRDDARRFIKIDVDPVTGIATVGDIEGTAPSGLTLPVSADAVPI
jgi:prepilin-type N-terminal cleavage/methylation domain-containing protein